MCTLGLIPIPSISYCWHLIETEAFASNHPASEAITKFKDYFINTCFFPLLIWNHYKKFEP